ncbi:uncharacterized protein DDB_G0284459 isoform X2 [Camponotus floridanus]|nr:uncharacterized protein DDB_G0284459 isoform X2 [Camponotus floridanus]XP_025267638.1 uncharacterized protein DDB_G0284459 isoform X2 [Camponotus floridanus]XP_025267639.1 uncharacterized protein DDB_G0284459 isoform X2 [Camponotus floridanus]XP_025267640.1 uncharacterized protein DDB_G0284459 isoform X2 [Camponotus floridanus]XP_025267641.1 uncharacterized protein DDB_G0284459 isoform X2 [Camponotus floridanus]
MNPTGPTNVPRQEETRSARNEDYDSHSNLRSRTEEEILKCRHEWQQNEERERQHEKLKQQKILEYETQCAQALGYAESKSLNHNQSKSRSKSPSQDQHKGRSMTRVAQSDMLFEKIEEERLRRRREWQWKQKRERQYEKLKQQKILEYERKRAQALGYAEPKSVHHSRSKSSSKSPQYRHRGRSWTSASKSGTLFEKLEGSTSGTIPLFKGFEGIQINTKDLRRIKVIISRNIPVNDPIPDLQRNIINAEDVILKRREGEGSKPIFDREEIEKATKINEIEERHTAAIDGEQQSDSTDKSQTSSLLSSILYDSEYLSFDQFSPKSHTRSLMEEKSYCDRYRDRSSEHSRKRKDRNRDSDRSRKRRRDKDRDRDKSRERRRDRDRDRDKSRERRRDRDRDRDRSRERKDVAPHYVEPPIHVPDRDRDRDKSKERKDVAPHYVESPIHVPIYYNLPPSPIVVSPMVPFRGQVPPMARGRHSALMAPVRPFPPWFIPPDMYRLRPPPPNPRYGPF